MQAAEGGRQRPLSKPQFTHLWYTVLHSFAAKVADRSEPFGSLTESGSMLYGMTYGGGSADGGTIFSVDTDNHTERILNSIGRAGDGFFPFGSLTRSGPMLYGMTAWRGAAGPVRSSPLTPTTTARSSCTRSEAPAMGASHTAR